MIYLFVLLWATVVAGRPNVVPLNVVTVPPNCPVGQQWINGQCRDIWNVNAKPQSDLDVSNVITVPPNCPAGQEWINGACRDIWRSLLRDNIVKDQVTISERGIFRVPILKCPNGYRRDDYGVCRKRFP